jgi:hypothetical protein
MNTKTIEYNPFEHMVVPELEMGTEIHPEPEYPLMLPPQNEVLSLEYVVREILDRVERLANQETSLIPHHLGQGVVFSGTVVVPYPEHDMVTTRLSEDPLYTQRDRFPIPRKVLNQLKKLQRIGVDFETLFIAHEIPKDTLRSGDPLTLDLVNPPPCPENVAQAEMIGDLSRITWVSAIAPALPVLGVSKMGVSVTEAVRRDPILFGLKVQRDSQPKTVSVADWFYLCRWTW